MKIYIKILIILLLLLPAVHAWKAETHENIIEYVYLNLPVEVQTQLNLTKLKEGAVMPDRDFKDFRRHHYPASLEEANKWLNNNSDLSLNLGIASHYITDSFAAPHNIPEEKYSDHSYFEKQVAYYYPNIVCKDYGFAINNLHTATKNSEDWDIWLKSKNKKIPQKEVDESTKFLFSVVLNKLNTTCNNVKTEVIDKPYINRNKIIIIYLISMIGFFFLRK